MIPMVFSGSTDRVEVLEEERRSSVKKEEGWATVVKLLPCGEIAGLSAVSRANRELYQLGSGCALGRGIAASHRKLVSFCLALTGQMTADYLNTKSLLAPRVVGPIEGAWGRGGLWDLSAGPTTRMIPLRPTS
jgi:hypothetical protein